MQLQHFKVHELVVPTTKDREITYKWKSKTQDLETLEHTGEPVGIMVLLEIGHDQRNKHLTAVLRKVHWKKSEMGYEIQFISPFDKVNYPYLTILREPITRYSEKALKIFQRKALITLDELTKTNEAVANLVKLATDIV